MLDGYVMSVALCTIASTSYSVLALVTTSGVYIELNNQHRQTKHPYVTLETWNRQDTSSVSQIGQDRGDSLGTVRDRWLRISEQS